MVEQEDTDTGGASVGRLDGKVAIITGGARGQGAAEVRRFVGEGAKVVFGDVLDDLGHQVAAEVGDGALYVHHDVSREDDWERVVGEAERRFGKLDVLVTNAGILEFGTVTHETAPADYLRVIEVNQMGAFLGMRAAIPAMMRQRGGSIVNISSTNGFAGYGGTIAYTASKFAVRGMTKTAALEYGKANIRVNSIHPGGIDTPMTRGADLGGMTEEEQDAMYGNFALGRAGKPEEVADLALFLASDESAYCTGAEFIVDGGMLAGVVNPYARPTYE
jgi:3alpha(or 20beta)-hydroxysteroid dehydrogenase